MSNPIHDAGHPYILVVGGADTGRAPMIVAFLRQMLTQRQHNWPVESAGVVGHDGDQAEPEARDAMATFQLDLNLHQARSLTDEQVATTNVILAVDRGIVRVMRTRYPTAIVPIVTLGELAGQQRDIPDPFRMQIGAWISYAREIETLLRAGIDRLIQIGQGLSVAEVLVDASVTSGSVVSQRLSSPAAILRPVDDVEPPLPIHRSAPIERCERLLTLMRDMPGLVEWPNARRQLVAELTAASAVTLHPTDLVQPYVTMLTSLLNTSDIVPTAGQVMLLNNSIARLRTPIDQHMIAQLATEMAEWAQRE